MYELLCVAIPFTSCLVTVGICVRKQSFVISNGDTHGESRDATF